MFPKLSEPLNLPQFSDSPIKYNNRNRFVRIPEGGSCGVTPVQSKKNSTRCDEFREVPHCVVNWVLVKLVQFLKRKDL